MSKLPGIPHAPGDGPVVPFSGKGKPYMIGTIFNTDEQRFEVVIQFGDFKSQAEADMFSHLIAPKVQEWAGGQQAPVSPEKAS